MWGRRNLETHVQHNQIDCVFTDSAQCDFVAENLIDSCLWKRFSAYVIWNLRPDMIV